MVCPCRGLIKMGGGGVGREEEKFCKRGEGAGGDLKKRRRKGKNELPLKENKRRQRSSFPE